jgi:hypothetical protein
MHRITQINCLPALVLSFLKTYRYRVRYWLPPNVPKFQNFKKEKKYLSLGRFKFRNILFCTIILFVKRRTTKFSEYTLFTGTLIKIKTIVSSVWAVVEKAYESRTFYMKCLSLELRFNFLNSRCQLYFTENYIILGNFRGHC